MPTVPARSAGQVVTWLVFGLVMAVTVTTLAMSAAHLWNPAGLSDDPLLPLKRLYWVLYRSLYLPIMDAPLFYLGLPVLLALQALRPAVRGTGVFHRGLWHDVAWMVIHAVIVGLFVFLVIGSAKALVTPWIAPLQLRLLGEVPAWLEILLGYLLIDFLGWFNHLIRHKVKLLWIFHEVHHSQTHMNPFTLHRAHPVDYLMAEAIMLLPAVLFEETLGIVLAYLTVSRLHDALTHSNIRTNLGWLRFVLVTPQSHRVHHAVAREYHDLNFGVTLSIWDRLFGTHASSDTVYPATGLPDPDFPYEAERPIHRLPLTLLAQLAYPFRKALRQLRRGAVQAR